MRIQEEDISQDQTEPLVEDNDPAPGEEECTIIPETPKPKRNQQTPLKTRKRTNVTSDSERLDHAFQILQSTANQVITNQDECYYFGNCVATKLRKYDDSTRCAIQNDIMNIFHQANLGRYKINTYTPARPTLQDIPSSNNFLFPGFTNPTSFTYFPEKSGTIPNYDSQIRLPVQLPYPNPSTSSEKSYNSQNDSRSLSPVTPQPVASPSDSTYSEDFNIQDLV